MALNKHALPGLMYGKPREGESWIHEVIAKMAEVAYVRPRWLNKHNVLTIYIGRFCRNLRNIALNPSSVTLLALFIRFVPPLCTTE
jgi:hypothetical protein